MPITIFRLKGTDWELECRPGPRDIVIWKGGHPMEIISHELAHTRLALAKEWMKKNVPGYNEDDMERIK
jgi:hypothetical protein